jgi:precorrin-6A/cobalt-precorrin-6A reductase
MKRVLILGGTEDARALAAKLATVPEITVVTSLAGRTQKPITPSGDLRLGGFGGVQGLVDYLQVQKIDGLIDATHPFAAQISWHAAAAAATVGIPRLMLVRPAWEKTPADRWIEVESIEAAAKALPNIAQPNIAKRVFLTIGRQELAVFAALSDIWFLMRMIDAPSADRVVPQGTLLLERGPFSDVDEQALLIQHGITAMVSKNSGGEATVAKIRAARALGIPVVMVQRPEMPEGEQVATVEDAFVWIICYGNHNSKYLKKF